MLQDKNNKKQIKHNRQEASEQIDKFREAWKLKMSNKELIKFKNYKKK